MFISDDRGGGSVLTVNNRRVIITKVFPEDYGLFNLI